MAVAKPEHRLALGLLPSEMGAPGGQGLGWTGGWGTMGPHFQVDPALRGEWMKTPFPSTMGFP